LRLAFLFVRIFQVFAALSLSILDVEPELEMKLISDITRLQGSQSVPLFGAKQMGGALNAKKYLPVGFEPFRGYLNEVVTRPDYYQISGSQIFIKHSVAVVDSALPVTYYYAITRKNGKTESGQINGSISVVQDGDDSRLLVRLTNLKKTTATTTETLESKTVRFTMARIGEPYRDKGQRPIPQGLSNAFDSLARGDTEDRNGNTSNAGKPKERSASITQFERDMGEVAEGLHTKTIVSAFTRTSPPKAHCVARALQLLSDSGMQSAVPKEIYSHICKTKFLTETRSLPPANERITKEDGIYALAQLFYDTLKESTPAISTTTQDQYKSFVTKMKFVFEEAKDAKVSIADIRKNPLDEVVNKVPGAVCDKTTLDKTLKTSNREIIRQLRDNVRRMIQYQIGHTANVVKILRKLFLLPIESGKSLQIHPKVLKNGMEEVNALAEEARNLLIDYYSQCEILYRSGAEIIAAGKSNMTAL
jgi:hypothetical protein